MRKSRPLTVMLIVAGVLLLFFAYGETAILTEVPVQNPNQTSNGLNIYSFNVTMTGPTVLTVINATGSYGLVSEQNAASAIAGGISQYAVHPSNSTGTIAANLTYTGFSGHYVFIEISGANHPPFLIMNANAVASSISGLLVVLGILMVIAGVFVYPFSAGNRPELQPEGTRPK